MANLEPVKRYILRFSMNRPLFSGSDIEPTLFSGSDVEPTSFSGSDVEPTTPILLSGVLGTTLCLGT